MTKLEQQIFEAQSYELDWVDPQHMKLIARVAAKIALELAEKAYNIGFESGLGSHVDDELVISFEDFKKDCL